MVLISYTCVLDLRAVIRTHVLIVCERADLRESINVE